jgi:hypothetical protein
MLMLNGFGDLGVILLIVKLQQASGCVKLGCRMGVWCVGLGYFYGCLFL